MTASGDICPGRDTANEAAALEHLTGPSRGSFNWLNGRTLAVFTNAGGTLSILRTGPENVTADAIAYLHRTEGGYEIECAEGRLLWVNGLRATRRQLHHSDIIEFGKAGPLSRYRHYDALQPRKKSIAHILSDTLSYLRASRRPPLHRALTALRDFLTRLALETTVLFRMGVVAVAIVFAALAYQQHQLNTLLRQQATSSEERMKDFANALTRARREALTPHDLEALRLELKHGLTSNQERLEQLERRSTASARTIAAAAPAVVFLQGAYGFKEKGSQRMLRHVVDDQGQPLITAFGQPLLSLEGTGAVAERQFMGTGFIAGERGALITNRHLALPWESDSSVQVYARQDLEPVMVKFVGYLPGQRRARSVALVAASEQEDLAVLRWEGAAPAITGLRLASSLPTAGDEIIVMGYPTGLRAMLAHAGDEFVESLQTANETDFWTVAARLAEKAHITPLASRGIISHVTSTNMVYDADTTHGGSGGPVLNADGQVVGVNTAIIPEYGGSNFGVPIERIHKLLKLAGLG